MPASKGAPSANRPALDAAIARLIERTRTRRGLPEQITDTDALRRIGTIVEGAARRGAA